MRIVQIVESLDMGGLERLAISLAVEQKHRGDEPHIYCVFRRGSLADEAEAAGIPVTSFEKRPGASPRTLFRIVRRLVEDRPHVVHTHNPGIHHYGAVAAVVARVPVIVNTRHSPQSSQGTMYRERYSTWAMRWTDTVVFVSEQVRQTVLNLVGNWDVPCSVIPCAISLQPYRARPASPGSVHPRVRFGTLGRMVPAKAQSVLLDAFARVLETIPCAELRVAGGGPLFGPLQEQATRLGIAERVSIETATNSAAFLQDLDVFVLSSRNEGLPLALLEAMAAGVPVVSTCVGGIPEVLSQDVGWLCLSEDCAALAESMIAAANSSDLLPRAARGVALVTQRYSIPAIYEQYRALFEQILASKGIQLRNHFIPDRIPTRERSDTRYLAK
jgi:glycosyltransferase involved in cell wall biosynthesis